jgi:hypothetical protein
MMTRAALQKTIRIAIPVLVVIGTIIAFLALENRHKYAWQDHLDHYLAYLRTAGQPSYQLLTAVPSSMPDNFTPQMSAESFSDSFIFQTSRTPNLEYSAGLQPMPYPPAELWCVLLVGGEQQQLVYLALHDTLKNADWIVHVPTDPWGSPQLQYNLQNLGCTLDV